MLNPTNKALTWLSPTDKEAVKKALLKIHEKRRGKGTKQGARIKTSHKAFVAGKAGGVTRQGGGTPRRG